jgi:uncharacterized protein YlxW (UPF0749 family)
MLMRRSIIALSAAVLLAVVGVASPAVGQSSDKYKKQLEEYSKQLDTLKEKDKWGVSKEDRSRARDWLESASERLAKGDNQTAGWLLQRTEDALDLIQVTVQAKQLEASADEQKKKYHQLKESRVPELKKEVEQLRQQKKELKSELQSL